jgi:hypothetical protein
MDETMGPCESSCPERILKLLTPTDSDYAKEWRARCQKNIDWRKTRPKIVEGSTITLYDKPYTVSKALGRRGYHIIGADGTLYRMSVARVRQVTDIKPPKD